MLSKRIVCWHPSRYTFRLRRRSTGLGLLAVSASFCALPLSGAAAATNVACSIGFNEYRVEFTNHIPPFGDHEGPFTGAGRAKCQGADVGLPSLASDVSFTLEGTWRGSHESDIVIRGTVTFSGGTLDGTHELVGSPESWRTTSGLELSSGGRTQCTGLFGACGSEDYAIDYWAYYGWMVRAVAPGTPPSPVPDSALDEAFTTFLGALPNEGVYDASVGDGDAPVQVLRAQIEQAAVTSLEPTDDGIMLGRDAAGTVMLVILPPQAIDGAGRQVDGELVATGTRLSVLWSDDLPTQTVRGHFAYRRLDDHLGGQASPAERAYCRSPRRATDCSRIEAARATAVSELQRRFSPMSQGDGYVGNAFLHCAWAARMSDLMGAEKAAAAAQRYEKRPRSFTESRAEHAANLSMDRYNDDKGLLYFERSPGFSTYVAVCERSARSGVLRIRLPNPNF